MGAPNQGGGMDMSGGGGGKGGGTSSPPTMAATPADQTQVNASDQAALNARTNLDHSGAPPPATPPTWGPAGGQKGGAQPMPQPPGTGAFQPSAGSVAGPGAMGQLGPAANKGGGQIVPQGQQMGYALQSQYKPMATGAGGGKGGGMPQQ